MFQTLAAAYAANTQPLNYILPTRITAEEKEARKLAELEHAHGVAVRINRRFQLEYYNEATGEIVSVHY